MTTKIIRYKGEKAYRKGLQKMAAKGWDVKSCVSSVPRSGCLRIILLGGLLALVFRPKTEFHVVFER
jgi:hypothetical protein